MPRKETNSAGTLRPNIQNATLEEVRLRALIRRLRQPVLGPEDELFQTDRDYLADTLEAILSVTAEQRWKAALGLARRGRPSAKNHKEAHRQWLLRKAIAQRVLDCCDGRCPDGKNHPLVSSRDMQGALEMVAEEQPTELMELLSALATQDRHPTPLSAVRWAWQELGQFLKENSEG
jgi:hypothetical protein